MDTELAELRHALSRGDGSWGLAVAQALKTRAGWDYFLHQYLRNSRYHTPIDRFDLTATMRVWCPMTSAQIHEWSRRFPNLRERVLDTTGTGGVLEVGDAVSLRGGRAGEVLNPCGVFFYVNGTLFVGMECDEVLYYVELRNHLAALQFRFEGDPPLECRLHENRHWDIAYVTDDEDALCRVRASAFRIALAGTLADVHRYSVERKEA